MSEKITSFGTTSNESNATHGKTNKNTKGGSSRMERDGIQWTTAGSFLFSALFWLLALFLYHPEPWWVVQNAFVVLAVCYIFDSVVICVAPNLQKRLVLSHYILGVMQNILYVITFLISPDLFATVWNSIFFGYYLFTWIGMLTQKAEYFPMFRIFYTIHHGVAFIVTGIWIITSPCCFELDNEPVYRAIVIWLSGDIWNYCLNIYRCIQPETDKDSLHKMRMLVFVLEKLHKSGSYLQILVVGVSGVNTLGWVCTGSALVMDTLDSTFQIRSICKHHRAKKKRESIAPMDNVKSPRRDTMATLLTLEE